VTWTIDIPREVPSKNAHHVNGGTAVQMAIYRKLRNEWAKDIRTACLAQWSNPAAFMDIGYEPRRKVTFTRIMGPRQREYDYDGLVGGFALILDALKPAREPYVTTWKSGPRKGKMRVVKGVPGAGLIVDDSPKWVELEYRQEWGVASGTRITLEDV
jgi:hypothetical protein